MFRLNRNADHFVWLAPQTINSTPRQYWIDCLSRTEGNLRKNISRFAFEYFDFQEVSTSQNDDTFIRLFPLALIFFIVQKI